MCVPGAMAATSAAMVIRKPADAARLPDGDTKTATGVFDWMMAVLMSRVESTRPPGVRSTMTSRSALAASACAIARRMYAVAIGMDDAVDFDGVDDGGALSAAALALMRAAAPDDPAAQNDRARDSAKQALATRMASSWTMALTSETRRAADQKLF